MNILVTGGSGFIGTNLSTDLLKEGHKVTIYDKQKSKTYPDLCIVGDIRDKEKLTRSMSGVDAVYHLAAEHRDDVHPASLYYEVNVGGAENIVCALKKNDVKQFIFTSTVAVYGLNSGMTDEDSRNFIHNHLLNLPVERQSFSHIPFASSFLKQPI